MSPSTLSHEVEPTSSVVAAVAKTAAKQPGARALTYESESLTYGEVAQRMRQIAGGLRSVGAQSGETIITMMDNHIDHVLITLALNLTGGVEVPANTAYRGSILEYLVHDSGATLAVIDAKYLPVILAASDARAGSELRTIVVRGKVEEAHAASSYIPFESISDASPLSEPDPDPSQLSAIMYTSGTTGPPKGVMVPNGQVYTAASLYPKMQPEDVALTTLPLFHVAGRWIMVFNALIHGAEAVIVPRFSASSFWQTVRDHGVTTTLFVGGMVEALSAAQPTDRDRDHTLRVIEITPWTARLAEFADRFGVEIVTGYGGTEVGTISQARLDEGDPGTCGWMIDELFEARLVDECDREVPVGAVGEMVVRSRRPWTLSMGYYKNEKATLASWRNLWFHTGDHFRSDESGQYFFVSRKSDSIRCRGENVSVFDLENTILARDDIHDAVAIGVASERADDEIKAILVTNDPLSFDVVKFFEWMAEELPYFMVPRYIEVTQDLPRNFSGKVRRADLRSAGVTAETWDSVEAGYRISRAGVTRVGGEE